jgi:hypothetical protein
LATVLGTACSPLVIKYIEIEKTNTTTKSPSKIVAVIFTIFFIVTSFLAGLWVKTRPYHAIYYALAFII